nr:MAG: nonstructural protein 2 [Parvoviridae sp.]
MSYHCFVSNRRLAVAHASRSSGRDHAHGLYWNLCVMEQHPWIDTLIPTWQRLDEAGKKNSCDNWKMLIKHACTSLEETNSEVPSDFAIFNEGSRKLMENWTVFEKKWSADTFEKLKDKASSLLKSTIAKSICTETRNTVLECLTDSTDALLNILDDCSSGPTKETTCMSSMIAPIPTDSAGATSENPRTFEENFEALCDAPSISRNSTRLTGRTFSYISSCPNGKAIRKYGLMEDIKDCRVVLKLYDGETCRNNPDRYWIGKRKELDISLDNRSQIAKTIENLFLRVYKELEKRGAYLREEDEEERRPNFSVSRRRYKPY